jgi:hypothetical protein
MRNMKLTWKDESGDCIIARLYCGKVYLASIHRIHIRGPAEFIISIKLMSAFCKKQSHLNMDDAKYEAKITVIGVGNLAVSEEHEDEM